MMQVGKPVTGKEFIGRQKEAREIIQYLSMGQSVVLIAPRRFGKTSLTLEVIRQLKQANNYTAYIDVFAHANLKMLTESIVSEVLDNNGLKKAYHKTKGSITQLMKNLKLKAVVEDFEFLLGMEDKTVDEWTNFSDSLKFINGFASKSNKPMVFAFDEFGDMLKYDKSGEIIKLFRSVIQKQDSTTYLFSGSYESVMNELFVDNNSPFYRLARVIKLGYLEYDILEKHIITTLKSHGIAIPQAQVIDLITQLKGHPYYCQLALQQIYLFYNWNRKLPSTDEVIELIIQVDGSYFEKTWENISSNKELTKVLKHISQNSHGLYRMASENKINASRAITQLTGKGIIYKTENGYDFYDPVLKFWIHKTIYA
ncbi:MAG: AAA-like domain-containing protein [Bacteroidales bacterium]|jgi:AAA+ ATPase superfamily predicted ATPase|nr:AAA-like domain-containing protein [Bacteroidales bacterium]